MIEKIAKWFKKEPPADTFKEGKPEEIHFGQLLESIYLLSRSCLQLRFLNIPEAPELDSGCLKRRMRCVLYNTGEQNF